MRSGCGDVGVTQATEDVKIVIGWGRLEQKTMRCIAPSWFARPDVEKESGGVESIWTETCGHVCMEKQHTDTLIEGAKDTFITIVLLGCVWTCKAKDDAMSRNKMSNGEIIKFFSVIRLKVSNGVMKVGVDVSIK